MSIEDYVYVGKYKYKTEDLLGCGYYGKVYKGCKTEDETFIVAIKVSKKTPESDYELYAIKKLMDNPHDNIVIFYDCYERLNELVLVMEYCNGGTLDEYKEEAHIDFKTINIFMLMLAKAIKHLKSLGIVHRDLKPDNILLKKDFGATPTLKIADFGTARWIGITGHPDPCPTSPYAADFTENCSEVVFEPVDNFSLGRICWSLVRRQPHSNSPERSKLQKIINGLEKVAAKRMTVEEVIRILSFQPNNDEHPYDDEQPNDDNSMLAAESSVFAGTSSEFAGTSSEFAGTSSEFAGTSSKFVAISSICTSIFGLIILTKIGTPGFIIALVALVLAMVLIIELAFSSIAFRGNGNSHCLSKRRFT